MQTQVLETCRSTMSHIPTPHPRLMHPSQLAQSHLDQTPHPDVEARPSAYDIEHAWPVYSYIIVSVENAAPGQMTCWVLRDDRSQFDPQDISIGA